MVVTRKHDGSPRRTVDLSPLNKHCKRETFASESPFHLARRVPKYTWKTVTDAWNGYHSVPLREADTSPLSSPHMVDGGMQEHLKAFCRQEMATIVDLILSFLILNAKSVVLMTPFTMILMQNLKLTGGELLTS